MTPHNPTPAPPTTENPYAGQGPVLLDIGGDVGALVVRMPEWLIDAEVEIRPMGTTTAQGAHQHAGEPGSGQDHVHHPHVAVVPRATPAGLVPSLVYPEVSAGSYELFPLPDGPVGLAVSVTGGRVTQADWPA